MKKVHIAIIVQAISILLVLLLYIFRFGGENYILITDSVAMILSFVTVLVGSVALLRYGLRSLHGKSLLMLLMGFFLWFFAEFLWFLFGVKVVVFLELLRLIGYIPLTIGIFYIIKLTDPSFRKKQSKMIKGIVAFVVFSFLYIITIPYIFGGKTIFKAISTYGYVITDIVLLFGVLVLLKTSFSLKGGKMSKIYIFFALGFFAIFLFDFYYALPYIYVFGHVSEVFWLLGYIFTSFGFFLNIVILDNISEMMKKFQKNL